MDKEQAIFETCILLVKHFKNMNSHTEYRKKISLGHAGFHTRIFSHILHPEKEFVYVGSSVELNEGEPFHPEHIVPCVVLMNESIRLIKNGHSDEYIAKILQRHWKVAHITKGQAKKLDQELGLKTTMPSGWNFETGSSLARLEAAGIKLREE